MLKIYFIININYIRILHIIKSIIQDRPISCPLLLVCLFSFCFHCQDKNIFFLSPTATFFLNGMGRYPPLSLIGRRFVEKKNLPLPPKQINSGPFPDLFFSHCRLSIPTDIRQRMNGEEYCNSIINLKWKRSNINICSELRHSPATTITKEVSQ